MIPSDHIWCGCPECGECHCEWCLKLDHEENMSDCACDRCGLEDPYCNCYLYEVEKRVTTLEEELDKLTEVVKAMSDYIRKEKDE